MDRSLIYLTKTDKLAFSSNNGSGSLFYNQVEIGTYGASGLGGGLNFTFNNSATEAAISEVVHALKFKTPNTPLASGNTVVGFLATDKGGRRTHEKIVFKNENEAPYRIDLFTGHVSQTTKAGGKVGTLSGEDRNVGDTLSFALIDNADGRFGLSGTDLTLVDPSKISFTYGTRYVVKVRATDSQGAYIDGNLEISVLADRTFPTTPGTSTKVFSGSVASDVLTGSSTSDIISGKEGNDRLTGGAGSDVFVFETRPNRTNVDRIMDFKPREDHIQLDDAIFRKVGKIGVLKNGAFWTGDKAHDRDDRIIYNKKTGALYYDADGNGKTAAVKFAELSKKLALKHTDFLIA
jgi:Ca2+-binding RTX toxin-like protein